MKKTIFSLLAAVVLLVSASLAEKPLPSRAYFENLDKDSSLEDIVKDIGNYGVEGSGILYYVWHLDDGTKAKVVFDSKGRIVLIYIVSRIRSERIYKRQYAMTEAGAAVSDTPEADLREAAVKMKQAIGEQIPASGRMDFPDPDRPEIDLYDLTGDGCPDLFTNVTWGSGMVRTDLVAYDPVSDALYVLDGYDYDYVIEYAEDDRIVIRKEGPNGYGDSVTKTYGTVKLENGNLIFVPDSKEP